MGANAVTAGNQIQLSQLDALFARLYNLTNTHKNSSYQINASAISAAQASSGLSAGSPVSAVDGKIALLKTELANLANSKWYKSSTSGTIVQMTDFSTNFSVPAQGTKITASDFNLIENAITLAEQITPVYNSKYTSQYNSQYTSQYTSKYTSKYKGCYSGCYWGCYFGCYFGQYSGQYDAKYNSCYIGKYAACYSGQYSACYSGQYSGKYSGCYSGKYSSQYTTRYSAEYKGRYAGKYGVYTKNVIN